MKENILLGLAALLLLTGCTKEQEPSRSQPAPQQPKAKANVPVPHLDPTAPGTPAPPPPPGQAVAVAPAPGSAPTNEDGLLAGKGRPLTEEEKSLLNYGIYMFKEEKGRFPKDLNEAVKSRHISRMPQLPAGESLNYDPKTGLVTVVKKK